MYYDGIALCRQTGGHRTDIVFAVVGHDVVGGNEGGHIATGLCRQVGVQFPVILVCLGDGVTLCTTIGGTVTADGLVDILRTAVVGGNHQVPITEDTVEVPQVAGSGIR